MRTVVMNKHQTSLGCRKRLFDWMQRELREEYIESGSDGEWSELKFAKWVVSEMKKSKNAN